MDNFSVGEVGGVFAGIVALAAALGKGVAWLLNWNDVRAEQREARLAAWEKSLADREKAYRAEIETRLDEAQGELDTVRREVRSLSRLAGLLTEGVIDLANELHVHVPQSVALVRLRNRLDTLPLPETPPELAELARRLDQTHGE